jgi:hypothetical protein
MARWISRHAWMHASAPTWPSAGTIATGPTSRPPWCKGSSRGAGGDLDVRLGRDTVRMGGMIDGAGHFDRFSQAPLIKRAVFDDAWIDDGGAIAWRRPDADGVRALELGVWRGRAFPRRA